MGKRITVRPGARVEVAGQYILADADCKPVLVDGKPSSEATLAEGDKAPPTPEKGMVWLLVDASKHTDTPDDLPVDSALPPGMPPARKAGGDA